MDNVNEEAWGGNDDDDLSDDLSDDLDDDENEV